MALGSLPPLLVGVVVGAVLLKMPKARDIGKQFGALAPGAAIAAVMKTDIKMSHFLSQRFQRSCVPSEGPVGVLKAPNIALDAPPDQLAGHCVQVVGSSHSGGVYAH